MILERGGVGWDGGGGGGARGAGRGNAGGAGLRPWLVWSLRLQGAEYGGGWMWEGKVAGRGPVWRVGTKVAGVVFAREGEGGGSLGEGGRPLSVGLSGHLCESASSSCLLWGEGDLLTGSLAGFFHPLPPSRY